MNFVNTRKIDGSSTHRFPNAHSAHSPSNVRNHIYVKKKNQRPRPLNIDAPWILARDLRNLIAARFGYDKRECMLVLSEVETGEEFTEDAVIECHRSVQLCVKAKPNVRDFGICPTQTTKPAVPYRNNLSLTTELAPLPLAHRILLHTVKMPSFNTPAAHNY